MPVLRPGDRHMKTSCHVSRGAGWISRVLLVLILGAATPCSAQDEPRAKVRRNQAPGEVITPPAKGEWLRDELLVGAPAPDFTLSEALGKNKTTLSSFRGKKPVVLIFGSFTCPPFRTGLTEMDALYQKYKERAEFLFVYIREAHPDSILRVSEGGQMVLKKIGQTNDLTERAHVAQQCTQTLKLTMPTLIDAPDNRTNAAYAGWPNRLIIVAKDGTVAYKEPEGASFKPAAVDKWLEGNLSATP
jgi:thiol-disulfide isomerase/thioredoxin